MSEDLHLVVEAVASTPLPKFLPSISTTLPREVIEAARRVKETLDAN